MEDVQDLLDKATLALKRDITNILQEGSSKKLSPSSARDLANYIKILSDLAKAEKGKESELKKASTEELKELAKQLLD